MSETIIDGKKQKLFDHEQLESAEPSIIFGIPRFAIIHGLLHFPDFMLNNDPKNFNFFFKESIRDLKMISDYLCHIDRQQFQQLGSLLFNGESACLVTDTLLIDTFHKICLIADKLHSGEKAKFFVDILGKVFKMHE